MPIKRARHKGWLLESRGDLLRGTGRNGRPDRPSSWLLACTRLLALVEPTF